MDTATEIRIKVAEFERRMVPMRAGLNRTLGQMLAIFVHEASRRRRKSKGWRRHVRRMKART